jgi:hypothetical protein
MLPAIRLVQPASSQGYMLAAKLQDEDDEDRDEEDYKDDRGRAPAGCQRIELGSEGVDF